MTYTRDKDAFRTEGVLVLNVAVPTSNGEVKVVARFPDHYPYFRFEVTAPGLSLEKHQNPFSKSLCLVGRATLNWRPSDTLASLLTSQLPAVLDANSPETHSKVTEEPQGEPISDYYPYMHRTGLVIDSAWALEADHGSMELVVADGSFPEIRGVVTALRDDAGKTLAEVDFQPPREFREKTSGRWFRLEQPLMSMKADEFDAALLAASNGKSALRWSWTRGGAIDIVGITFPEEHSVGVRGRGWLFFVRYATPQMRKSGKWRGYFVRALRGGRDDYSTRIPELEGLRPKKVLVVGLGCLGAPSVIEFAKAGVGEIRILDHDHVDPATSVRWPLGIAAAGIPKAEAMARFIAENYPRTVVISRVRRLGAPREDRSARPEEEILAELLFGADLIYDATAEIGISHLLSDYASREGIPYVSVSSTVGGWGGLVTRIKKGTGCWSCFLTQLGDGRIRLPSASETAIVQPAGCGNPTFTGAGFDVLHVALLGVRTAVATLGTQYPNPPWDVATLDLRESDGSMIEPRWSATTIAKTQGCRSCADL